MTLVDRKIVASVLSVRLYRGDIQIWCTALHIYDGRVLEVVWGMGGGWEDGRRYLCGLKNWEEGGAPTDQTTTPSWRIMIYDSTYTGFYTILVRIWQMFTSWNDDPWPGFQKETFHSFEVEQGVAAGWLEDIQHLWYNVMMCTIIHISILHPTFGTMHCIALQWLRQPESGSIMVAIFFTAPLFSFKVKVFPRFLCKCVLYDSMFNILLFSFHRCHLFK